jgi:GTP-binding protein HflX
MLESSESLLPKTPDGRQLRVVTAGYDLDSLEELDRLLQTLGVKPDARLLMAHKKISPATYIGKGKIDELKALVESKAADAVVINVELSPNQLRNVEKELGKPTLDRPGVIIEIFFQHARTRESKTQVELARLQYLLPRLAHFWSHFERQRGGGVTGRGMGEKQIEVDRRLVKKRISILKDRLKGIENERNLQRKGRKDVLKVALVGYTNAGKSTLLNALTQSHVRAEDKLFATLDASVRTLNPDSHPPVVAIDTVGFISDLPPSLIASFRSTLEELREADLLVHVVDASSSAAKEQFEVTEKVLGDLKVGETPRVTVLNKIDNVRDRSEMNRAKLIAPGAFLASALDPEDIRRLRERILGHFRQGLELWEIVVPYSESKLEAQLYAYGSVEVNRHLEKGTFYRLRIEEGWAKKLNLGRFRL